MGQEWDQGRNQKLSGNKWKQTHNNTEMMGHREGSPERKVHSDTGLPKKDKNISNKQPNPTPTKSQEKTTKTSHSRYKEGNKQDQVRSKQYRD